jgi:hypothetical protein
MFYIPGDLQTAFGAKAIKNGDLRVSKMPADKRLAVLCTRPYSCLLIDQSGLS